MVIPGQCHVKCAKMYWLCVRCLQQQNNRKKRPWMEQKAPHWWTNNEINFMSIKDPSLVLFVLVCVRIFLCLHEDSKAENYSTHQLLFHVCRTCGSWMLCLSACSSRKSNMYLMASGRALPRWAVLKIVSNRSSTNFCNVPYRGGRGDGKLITGSTKPGIFSFQSKQ